MAAKPRARYLYTETRLNLDAAYPTATLQLQVPSTSSSWNPLAASSSPLPASSLNPLIYDEATFSRTHLASEASIFFRRENRSPRSFLWRFLDDRKLLELQAVDLTQTVNDKNEALLTIQILFPSVVRPYGVAFGDPEDRDALVIFALTVQGDLYTINLHKDVFIHTKAAESLPPDWCKSFNPPALRIREPYRLFAPSVSQLLLSLTDGGILQLERKHADDGSHWSETYFSAPGWSLSLPRKLAKWRGENFIRFGDTELDSSTASSIVMSPDEENIITVCLNHTIRIWNASTGKITLQSDLIEAEAEKPAHQPKFLLGPNQRQLLQVLDIPGHDGDQYYIVTFSPKHHQFAFWAVLDADSGFDGIRRVQPEFEFTPPIEELMDTSSWNLEEFYVRANRGWTETQLWLRARAGPISRVFRVQFSLFDDLENLDEAWKTEWTAIAAGRQSTEYLNQDIPPELQKGDSNLHCPNMTEKWLDFLFYPGRFTESTLETALHVYSKGSASTRNTSASKSKASLKERLSDAVLSKVSARVSNTNHDIQEVQTSEQWYIFYGLVQELHKRRSATLSFAMDMEDRLPWIISADSISPIRICTDLDICDFHRTPERNVPTEDLIAKKLESTYEVLDLLHVAHVFRSSLPPSFQDQFRRAVISEGLQEPSSSIRDRMITFHEEANLATGVSQEDWDRFNAVLEESGGFDVLDQGSFMAILEQMDQQSEGKDHDEQITRYGARALIRTAQETLALNLKTLLDLLLLTVFVEVEVEEQELQQSMQSPWKGQDIYVDILAKLKEHAVLDFLMQNMRIERPKKSRRLSTADSPAAQRSSQTSLQITYTSTLMESLFIGDWSTIHYREDSELPDLITYWARRWISSQGLSTQYDSFTEHVFADLIKHGNDQLCEDFMPYVPSTVWGMYLKGRLYLSRGEFDMAATCFRKAAFGLSTPEFKIIEADTARLLRPDEQEFFGFGLTAFYEHIMDLFMHIRCSSYVVEFAQAAIQHHELDLVASEKKHTKSSKSAVSAHDQKATALFSRLFTAALDSAQYEVAYSALTRIHDNGLRKASLTSFASTLVTNRRSDTLLAFPFASLAADLDAVLANLANKSLSASRSAGSLYFRVLYALRIQRSNYHGAAQSLWDYLARLKGSANDSVLDPRDERLTDTYLLVINALRCCGPDEEWVLDDPLVTSGSTIGGVKFVTRLSGSEKEKAVIKKRKVIFLADVRREYQELLDRVSDLEGGRFAFVREDEMEVDVL